MGIGRQLLASVSGGFPFTAAEELQGQWADEIKGHGLREVGGHQMESGPGGSGKGGRQ